MKLLKILISSSELIVFFSHHAVIEQKLNKTGINHDYSVSYLIIFRGDTDV